MPDFGNMRRRFCCNSGKMDKSLFDSTSSVGSPPTPTTCNRVNPDSMVVHAISTGGRRPIFTCFCIGVITVLISTWELNATGSAASCGLSMCSARFAELIRREGSFSIKPPMKLRRCVVSICLSGTGCCKCARAITFGPPINGKLPVANSKSKTPKLYRSLLG